jgi:hypothetical protein
MYGTLLHRFVALLLATNYFAFQVELFEEEYEANHRQISETCSIALPTLNWETFDKTNAQKAFVLTPDIVMELLHVLPFPRDQQFPPFLEPLPVRDKSPPAAVPVI